VISKNKNILHNLIVETIEEVQKERLDSFIAEFDNFDVKRAKEQLKAIERKLVELKRNAARDLFNKKQMHTKPYQMAKKQFVDLQDKINRYEKSIDEMDTLAIKHKQHIFKKHGKIV
jgi:hypothetical protein